jgi:pSer/pThr/pTyr-binding forkhead associated (FHA) protein
MSERSAARRAILQVCSGPLAFRKTTLEPGQVLRVGRGDAVGLSLAHDAQLSGAHFELSWDGEKCWIRDLATTTGTLLDGQPVQEGVVPHGGWIRAGGTDFVARVEHHTPAATAGGEPRSPQRTESMQQALSVLNAQEELYAVLDTARSDRILTLLQESVEEHRSLYEGPQAAALSEIAPYLVQLPRGSKLLESLIHEGWGDNWGIYLTSKTPFIETRRHLRKFLMVALEGMDNNFYFRFYDPRVLRDFLPTLAEDQRESFFGSITAFFYEDAKNSHLMTVHS